MGAVWAERFMAVLPAALREVPDAGSSLHKITVVRITDNDNYQTREIIANRDVSQKIIGHLGTQAIAIYDLF